MSLIGIIAVVAALVVTGIDWGLPSRAKDAFLFGSRAEMSGAEIAAYDADRANATLGADVDRDPVDVSGGPVLINRNEQLRAEIIRRYKLYSHQPDEMITFMALQQMNPAQLEFDPRLYQYGGVWVYPVGAMLKAASLVGIIDLRADTAFYYDNPDAFGRFYVVARFYTLAWMVVLLAAVATVVKKLTGDDWAAVAAAAIVGLCPVVFAMAHEAKPHLPGTALMLLACLAAARWVEDGRRRHAFFAGAACGLAAGMVLSAAVVVVVLPVMIFLRREAAPQRLAVLLGASLAAAIAYFITNPYVLYHLIGDAAALQSNLGNSKAMYSGGAIGAMLASAGRRMLEGASLPVLALFAAAVVAVVVRRKKLSPLAWLVAVPALVVSVQFIYYAAGKPAEYARFGLFAAVAFAIAAVWVVSLIPMYWLRTTGLVLTTAAVAFFAYPYFRAFLADTDPLQNTRAQAAARLASPELADRRILQIFAPPAPFRLPPVDLWRWHLLLSAQPTDEWTGHVIVRPTDTPNEAPQIAGYRREVVMDPHAVAPITWANKPFEIWIREP